MSRFERSRSFNGGSTRAERILRVVDALIVLDDAFHDLQWEDVRTLPHEVRALSFQLTGLLDAMNYHLSNENGSLGVNSGFLCNTRNKSHGETKTPSLHQNGA